MNNADQYYTSLFNGIKATLPFWIQQTWTPENLDSIPFFDGRILRQLINIFKAGRTCAEDECVAEMLMCGGLPNGMSFFRMRPFWSPKAYLGHMGQNHHIST